MPGLSEEECFRRLSAVRRENGDTLEGLDVNGIVKRAASLFGAGDCGLCLEVMDDLAKMGDAQLHKKCVQRWIRRNNGKCPICDNRFSA